MLPSTRSACILVIIIFIFYSIEGSEEPLLDGNTRSERGENQSETCSISACDLIKILENKEKELERRVLSLEQPVWKISADNLRWPACEEGPCKCTPTSLTVNCWRLSFQFLPPQQTLPADTRNLDLGSNHIPSIHKYAFKDLIRLSQLDLSDNNLDFLAVTLFENLEGLRYLLLQRNNLDTLNTKVFKDLKNLLSLDLSENRITELPRGIWDNLSSLMILQLSRNRLKAWDNFQGLVNLEDLDLTGNQLSTCSSFHSLRKLKRLKLGENKLVVLPPDVFNGLHHLLLLNLQLNQIEEISTGIFQDLQTISTIDISGNLITELEADTFAGLDTLKELHLSRNFIEVIRSAMFKDLANLDRLSLFGNNIDTIENDAFLGLGNLTWLLLGNNMLSTIPFGIFDPMPRLRRLELDSNDLRTVDENALEAFSGSLQTIKLGKNAWHCDCKILYLANWIRDHSPIVWEYQPKCRGPGLLGGRPLHEMTFFDVCDGQWLSMQRIPSRVTDKDYKRE